MGSAFPAEPSEWFSQADRRELVTFSLADPGWVIHRAHPECPVEHPHQASECGRLVPRRTKVVQAGTLVRITRTKAPPGLPVDCIIEGVLLTDVEAEKPVYLATMGRDGELLDGVFVSSSVTSVTSVAQGGFATVSASYRVKRIGGAPGEFSILAKILLRELKPYEVQPM